MRSQIDVGLVHPQLYFQFTADSNRKTDVEVV